MEGMTRMGTAWRQAIDAGLLWTRMAETGLASSFTITARLWMIATKSPFEHAATRAEILKMVMEKQKAAIDASLAVQRQILFMTSPPDLTALQAMTETALGPYHRASRRNARRLGRSLKR